MDVGNNNEWTIRSKSRGNNNQYSRSSPTQIPGTTWTKTRGGLCQVILC